MTVLFADLTGYTALAASLDPEEVYRFLRPTILHLRRIVEGFGGTVPQILGDGFMAVFGAPVAHEDDAERAVRAALAVRDHVRKLNEGRDGVPFPEVHAGINSGEVMVAPSDEEAGFAVIGDTVNTASRLADLAPAGRVLVDEHTRSRTSGAIRFGPRRARRAKGKAQPVVTFEAREVLEPTPRRPRRPRPRFRDRTEVLELLQREARQAVRAGRSRVLVVAGEPGVGKSRLAAEFRERSGAAAVLEGRCIPFGQRLPLHALAEAVGEAAGVEAGTGASRAETAASRLAALMARGGPKTLHRDLQLLLGAERIPPGQPRGSVHDAARAARTILEHLAGRGVVVVILDDLHWADADLLSFLRTVERSPWASPVVFVGLSRLEGAPRGLPRVDLGILDEGSMRGLARDVLGSGVPDRVLEATLSRAGGNPLFLEESLEMLMEAGALRERAGGWSVGDAERLSAVPSSIRLLIAARLDGLPGNEKRLLQEAAVCGERTWDALLDAVSDVPDVAGGLASLESRGLLRRNAEAVVAGPAEYSFKHVLIRDVAYQSLPRADRAHLHGEIGEWLRRRGAGRGRERVAVLAHHFEQAWHLSRSRTGPPPPPDLAARAATYLRRWADQTYGYQARAAAGLYGRAIAICDQAGRAVPAAQTGAVLIGRAECLIEMGRHREARTDATRARATAERARDRGLAARALVSLGRCESDVGRMARARTLLRRATLLFESEGDVGGQGWALHRRSETWGHANYDHELADLREAYALFVASGDRWGRMVAALDLAYLLTTKGGPEFRRWFAEAARLAGREGDLRSRASLLRTLGYVTHYRGQHREAARIMREARSVAVDAGDRYAEADALLIGAMAEAAGGDPGEAQRLAEEALAVGRELQSGRIRASAWLAAARAAVRSGNPAGGSTLMRRVRMVLQREGIVVMSAEASLIEAEMLLDRGAWDAARSRAGTVPRQLRRIGWSLWEPLPSLVRARALLGSGRPAQAARDLTRAHDLARTAEAPGTLALASALLEQVLLLDGRPARRSPVSREADSATLAIAAENRALRALRDGDARTAADRLGEAVGAWEPMGTTVWLARAHAMRADALRRAGERRAGSASTRRARTVLEAVRAPAATRRSLLEAGTV